MNRREFLIGVTGAAALPLPAISAPRTPDGPRLGCLTYNLLKDYDLETIIRLLEGAGYESVGLRTGHKHGVEPSLNSTERARVRRRLESSRIKLADLGTDCQFHSPDAGERKKQIEIGRQFVDLAKDTGAPGIRVFPNALPKGIAPEVTIRNIAASVSELGDYGAKQGVEIWLEVHGEGTEYPKVIAAVMKAANHPQVGAVWNCNLEEVDHGSIRENFEALKKWIRHVHLHELVDDRYPWREFFTLLRASGYQRYTMCEVDEPSLETERFLAGYKALWTELNRPCS
jgi:sugar phosphate isomerase/epimerase